MSNAMTVQIIRQNFKKMWIYGVTILVCVIRVSSTSLLSEMIFGSERHWLDLEDIPITRFGTYIYSQELYPEDEENGCSNNETCLNKCCPIGQGFDIMENMCRDIPDEFNPPVWDSYSLMEGFNASKEFHILNEQIECLPSLEEDNIIVTDITRYYYLQSDGTLLVESYRAAGPELVFNITKYCFDSFITAENKTEWNALICHVKNDFETHFVLNGSCMLITCFLVLLRVVVFAWLPELRTLHGVILMAYLASFLVGFLLLGSKMLLMYEQNINRKTCVVLSFIIYFFVLSAFFWRNVMCYDIWWTFSGKRAISSRGSASRTRLYLYCAYAFGVPTALTILLAALEYSDFPREHALMPKLRIHGCNSLYGYSKLLYFYGPIMMLFVINMVLFTLTAMKIAAIKKETEMILQSKESGTHDRKNDTRRFTLYVKLFAVMVFLEVDWVLEIVAIFYPDQETVILINDMSNVIILIVIFLNFLCQKQTWIVIKQRCTQMRGLPTSGQTTGVSTSRTLPSQTSQSQDDTQSTDYSREKANPAVSQNDTQSTDYSREKRNPAASQNDTQSTDYSREKRNPAASQNDTQSTDYSREKANPAVSQNDTQSTDYSREKANPAVSQNDTQSTDYSREKRNPAASQNDTQSTDYSREKANPAVSQNDTQSTDYSREKANPAVSQNDTQLTDYSREKANPAVSQNDTQSTDYSREKANPAVSQNDTQLTDDSREKANPAVSQNDTQSTDYSREKRNPAASQNDTQSTDYSREKRNPAASQDNTQSTDYSREKTNSTVSQYNTQSTENSREKTNPAASQDYSQPATVEKGRTLPRGRIAINQPTTVERRQSLPLAAITHNRPTTDEKERTLPRARITLNRPTTVDKERFLPRARITLNQQTTVERRQTLPRARITLNRPTTVDKERTLPRARMTLNRPTTVEKGRTLPRGRIALNQPNMVERRRTLPRPRMTLNRPTTVEKRRTLSNANSNSDRVSLHQEEKSSRILEYFLNITD